jgi:hypothetical protein
MTTPIARAADPAQGQARRPVERHAVPRRARAARWGRPLRSCTSSDRTVGPKGIRGVDELGAVEIAGDWLRAPNVLNVDQVF